MRRDLQEKMDENIFDFLNSVESELTGIGRDRTVRAIKHYEPISNFLLRWNDTNYLLLNLVKVLNQFISPSLIFGRGKVTQEALNFYIKPGVDIQEITFDDYTHIDEL
jgi:hypothetical protein